MADEYELVLNKILNSLRRCQDDVDRYLTGEDLSHLELVVEEYVDWLLYLWYFFSLTYDKNKTINFFFFFCGLILVSTRNMTYLGKHWLSLLLLMAFSSTYSGKW